MSLLKLSRRSAVIAVVTASITSGCGKSGEKKKVGPAVTSTDKDAAVATAVPPPAGPKGRIKGSIKLTGEVPEMPKLQRGSDPVCARTEQRAETILKNSNGTLANVVVRVKPGTVEAWRPGDVVRVEQTACMYRPRVQAAVAGQKLTVENGDQTAHNVHLRELELGKRQGVATLLNRQQPKNMKPITSAVDDVPVIKLKCDQHGWMSGYIVVSDNGYAAVTGETGSFELEVPAGEIKIEAWHEFYGIKEQTVTVPDGGEVALDFTFDHDSDNPTAPPRPTPTPAAPDDGDDGGDETEGG
jgi:plastocyanin